MDAETKLKIAAGLTSRWRPITSGPDEFADLEMAHQILDDGLADLLDYLDPDEAVAAIDKACTDRRGARIIAVNGGDDAA